MSRKHEHLSLLFITAGIFFQGPVQKSAALNLLQSRSSKSFPKWAQSSLLHSKFASRPSFFEPHFPCPFNRLLQQSTCNTSKQAIFHLMTSNAFNDPFNPKFLVLWRTSNKQEISRIMKDIPVLQSPSSQQTSLQTQIKIKTA